MAVSVGIIKTFLQFYQPKLIRVFITKKIAMTELINKLIAEAGLSAEQAGKSLDVIKAFVKEKFPMLAGAVDNVFSPQVDQVAAGVAEAEANKPKESWLDKISDVIPGDIGEKIEGFAKKAADTAEDLVEKGKAKIDEWEKKV